MMYNFVCVYTEKFLDDYLDTFFTIIRIVIINFTRFK